MKKLSTLLLTTVLVSSVGGFAITSYADEVVVPVSQQSPELQDIPRPSNGMNMKAVESKYGIPVSTSGPVGKPPITTWEYDLFTVYFEHNLVIHTVLKHNPQ
ncbi:hypothetical protein [Litoribrevibacter albus]|uniref:Phosphodiesterase n=1 Tax=Litoribrevibacter albus TaxID=1473156 RepID=A0AA37SBM6_9GAMM|nr:hypothetical protein [Litoribrevibacter albus]GLQ31608.1 hypothetical protein GCM10007876_20870 [Litoribrevibacter albus]